MNTVLLLTAMTVGSGEPQGDEGRQVFVIPTPSEWIGVAGKCEQFGLVIPFYYRVSFTRDKVLVRIIGANGRPPNWAQFRPGGDGVMGSIDFDLDVKPMKAICTMQGHNLKICLAWPGDRRPTAFTTMRGTGVLLWVLQPVK